MSMTNKEFFNFLKQGLESINAPEQAFVKLTKLEEKTASNGLTEKNINILTFMNESPDELYSSQTIGVALGLTPRSVSGSMKKLVNEEYVEKLGQNPVCYKLTEAGKNFHVDE